MNLKTEISIYALIDPLTDEIRYVGRTVNKLSRRLGEHINTSLRGKIKNTAKREWIEWLLSQGARPSIKLLEVGNQRNFKELEKKWIAKLRPTGRLLNIKSGGDGGLGGHFVKWTKELDAMLGKVADSVIGESMGVSRKTVTYRREKLGILASYNRARNKPPPHTAGQNRKSLPDEILSRLGTMPDYKLATLAGVSKKTIARRRKERGIKPYAAITGNSGKFKVGMPHPRWSRSASA
jgi:hypothetical protein